MSIHTSRLSDSITRQRSNHLIPSLSLSLSLSACVKTLRGTVIGQSLTGYEPGAVTAPHTINPHRRRTLAQYAGAGDSEALTSTSHLEAFSSKLIANHLNDRRSDTIDKNFPPYALTRSLLVKHARSSDRFLYLHIYSTSIYNGLHHE